MKLWLGAALLLACLALALALLRRSEPPPAGAQPAAPLPPGWGSVVLGAPSDALPPAPAAETPQPAPAPAPVPKPAPPEAREFELSVSPGQTLSTICREHYGTASVALVAALARFNGMTSPDALRAGQKLRLPPLETLQKP